jgi:putative transposase
VSHLAVVADSAGGVRFQPNPQHLEQALSTLRRRSRQMARRRGPVSCDPAAGAKVRQVPSAGWREARRSLARAHVRVRHLRADGIAKLTSGGPTGAGGSAAMKQEPGIPHGSKTRTGTG